MLRGADREVASSSSPAPLVTVLSADGTPVRSDPVAPGGHASNGQSTRVELRDCWSIGSEFHHRTSGGGRGSCPITSICTPPPPSLTPLLTLVLTRILPFETHPQRNG